MGTALLNPYAPDTYNGVNDASPRNFADVAFDYVYDVTLTALQAKLDQQPIDNDADFVWRGLVLSNYTGAFTVQFSDSSWYYLSNGPIYYLNLVSTFANPNPVWPEIIIPAGGRIGINITDTSNSGNTIELVFKGVKRFAVNPSAVGPGTAGVSGLGGRYHSYGDFRRR